MEIKNFRQFVDETIEFAVEKDKSITIIHGENGSGKTTLLQAFNWCFYGVSDVFVDSREYMLNKKVASSMNVGSIEKICVLIKFRHNDIEHCIERTQNVLKMNDRLKYESPHVVIKQKNDKGIWGYVDLNASQNYIDSIFPKSLANYFLFDGERIRNLGDNNRKGKKDLKDAVNIVLNLDNLSNAVTHLKDVRKRIRDEYSDNHASSNQDSIIKEVEELENAIEKDKEELVNVENSIDQYKEMLKDISNKMSNFNEIKDKEKQRKELINDINRQEDYIQKSYNKIMKKFNDKSFSLFAGRLIDESIKYLDEFELKDGMIEGVDGKAIDQILSIGKCICGNKIDEGSEGYKALMILKKYLPPQSYGVMVNTFIRQINRMKSKSNNLENELNNEYNSYLGFKNVLHEKENSLMEVRDFMKNHSMDAVKETEIKRDKYLLDLENASTKRGRLVRIIESNKNELEKVRDERDKIDLNNENDKKTRKKESIVDGLIEYFETFFNEQEDNVRIHLQNLVSDIFRYVLHKNYTISFDDKYNFYIKDRLGQDVPMSEGEKQITSLSFITGIVNMAKDEELNRRFQEKTNYNAAEIYPVIMDSPFGSLDNEHRRNVAKKVPELSEQTILFASSSQWQGEVEDAMKNKVGREFYLDFISANSENHIEAETTKIREVF